MHRKLGFRCFPAIAPRYRQIAAGAALAAVLAAGVMPAMADPFVDPPVFTSANHKLELLMVAAAHDVPLAGGVHTMAWPYEVCARPAGAAPNACPTGTAHPLGGVRLQLQPGDTLKIRLVNKLPLATDAKHVADNPELINNPTNLHTHGLIVEPHRAEGPYDTYGDYVFVVVRNPANQAAPATPASMAGMAGHTATHVHPDMDYVDGAVEYKIDIGANHPSGLFWFHPHMHGVALNQVSAGMSGIITIGSPTDMCADAACKIAVQTSDVRHIVLKDMQVESDNTLLTQEDAAYCTGQPVAGEPARHGVCAGQVTDGGDHTGGHWFNTVNGQVYPQIDVGPRGNVWRIVNSSGSRSYELSLTDDATGNPILMQVLGIDGVTIDAQQGTSMATMQQLFGSKARPEACPGIVNQLRREESVCTTRVRLMPSSRIELRVLRADGGAGNKMATLRTNDYFTGGDDWPAIELAHVNLAPRDAAAVATLAVGGQATSALTSFGVLQAPAELQVPGTDGPVSLAVARAMAGAGAGGPVIQPGLQQAPTIAIDRALKLGQRSDASCQPLAPGHRRKILFGNPTPGIDGFGIGYVETDGKGHEIEATRQPIAVFDPHKTSICIPLAIAGGAVTEEWELVNLTDEDHNFHIHQTRFHVLAGGTIPGTVIPTVIDDAEVLHDNLPLPHAAVSDGCDGSVEAVKAGACNPPTAFVRIPFREVGDFVLHCHILEHEDGGMMTRIRVVAAPGA
jgi:L-ascorbate oxidase